MKRLILNADDFGMTAGINRAVVEAQQRGALTSATMIANGGAVEEAVKLAHSLPQLAVGCHVVLMHGAPLSPPEQVPSLLAEDGSFQRTFGRFAQAAIAGRFSAADIEHEVRAQIERLRGAGLAVTHLDTHKHAHVFPAVFRPLLRAAKECGVCAVRNPFEPEFSSGLMLETGAARRQTRGILRYVAVRGFGLFASVFREAAREEGIKTSQGTLGIALTAHWERAVIERMISRIPDGTWELICHPAYPDEAFHRFSKAGNAGLAELEALTASWFREALGRAGIELISYAEL